MAKNDPSLLFVYDTINRKYIPMVISTVSDRVLYDMGSGLTVKAVLDDTKSRLAAHILKMDGTTVPEINRRIDELVTNLGNTDTTLSTGLQTYSYAGRPLDINILKKANHDKYYIGSTDKGTELGLTHSNVQVTYYPSKFTGNTGDGVQQAISFTQGKDPEVFVRRANGNTWSGWLELVNSKNILRYGVSTKTELQGDLNFFNDATTNYNYEYVTDKGVQLGLGVANVYIKYMTLATTKKSIQIATNLDKAGSGAENFWIQKIRIYEPSASKWGPWFEYNLNISDITSDTGTKLKMTADWDNVRSTLNIHVARGNTMHNGPIGANDDGYVLPIFGENNRSGVQLWMSPSNDKIAFRRFHNGQWVAWNLIYRKDYLEYNDSGIIAKRKIFANKIQSDRDGLYLNADVNYPVKIQVRGDRVVSLQDMYDILNTKATKESYESFKTVSSLTDMIKPNVTYGGRDALAGTGLSKMDNYLGRPFGSEETESHSSIYGMVFGKSATHNALLLASGYGLSMLYRTNLQHVDVRLRNTPLRFRHQFNSMSFYPVPEYDDTQALSNNLSNVDDIKAPMVVAINTTLIGKLGSLSGVITRVQGNKADEAKASGILITYPYVTYDGNEGRKKILHQRFIDARGYEYIRYTGKSGEIDWVCVTNYNAFRFEDNGSATTDVISVNKIITNRSKILKLNTEKEEARDVEYRYSAERDWQVYTLKKLHEDTHYNGIHVYGIQKDYRQTVPKDRTYMMFKDYDFNDITSMARDHTNYIPNNVVAFLSNVSSAIGEQLINPPERDGPVQLIKEPGIIFSLKRRISEATSTDDEDGASLNQGGNIAWQSIIVPSDKHKKTFNNGNEAYYPTYKIRVKYSSSLTNLTFDNTDMYHVLAYPYGKNNSMVVHPNEFGTNDMRKVKGMLAARFATTTQLGNFTGIDTSTALVPFFTSNSDVASGTILAFDPKNQGIYVNYNRNGTVGEWTPLHYPAAMNIKPTSRVVELAFGYTMVTSNISSRDGEALQLNIGNLNRILFTNRSGATVILQDWYRDYKELEKTSNATVIAGLRAEIESLNGQLGAIRNQITALTQQLQNVNVERAPAVNSNHLGEPRLRNITISIHAPSGGSQGDIWLKYR